MRRCTNFSYTRAGGWILCAAPALWNTSFPRGPGLLRALEGLAAEAVIDSPGDICRGGVPCSRADLQGAQPSCTQDDSPSHRSHLGQQGRVGWGTGTEGGQARVPTHRSCALGSKPSGPLPALSLLEHTALCK